MNYQKIEKICEILTDKKMVLSVAESCTGGLISSCLTDINGASNFMHQNFVTYANEAKSMLLGVKLETIQEHGVVSKNVAEEMAKGLIFKGYGNVSISTTGILGPTGGSAEKPIGLVYIGFATANKVETFKYISKEKGRMDIKKDIVDEVFSLFYDFLIKNT